MENKGIRWIYIVIGVCVVLTAVGPCTLTHRYGPYFGKVIDRETGQPIGGAYVLVSFHTEMYTPGGFTSHYVEALETTTDQQGEFSIQSYRAWTFRFPQRWDEHCWLTVFKPGYGAFPNYASLIPEYVPFYSIPSKEHVIVGLRRLKTPEERWNNLHSVTPVNVPKEKLHNLSRLVDEEEKDLGLVR